MEVVGAIAGKIAEYTVAPIWHQFGYLIKYSSNIDSLRAQVQYLKDVQVGVQGLVAADKRNGQVIRPDVQTWLTTVNTITAELDSFLLDEVNPNQRCSSFSSCPNLILRYKVSRKANKNVLAVDELLLCHSKFDGVSFPPPPPSIFLGDVEILNSRQSTFNEIIEALKDDKTNIISVYGMGGIGKTTLVQDVAKLLAKEYKQLFDEIVMTVVSQTPSITKIQDDIASILGLKLDEKDILPIRAGRLRERINKSKRILVILDDLWARLDLEEIGLPQVDVHKGCKILLTTRDQHVCVQMLSQKKCPIGSLSELEAWDLFRKIAGDVVDSADLKPTAIKVAKECAGLPLSIVTVARTLMFKNLSDWKDALRRLENPSVENNTEMHTKVYSSLKLSYDFLDVREAKYCFLFCCLADEDSDIRIKNLVGFGMGLGIFDKTGHRTLVEIRDTIQTSVNTLKDRSLLLDGKYEDCVRMHDVVRDFAKSVVSKFHHGSWARMDIGSNYLSELNDDEYDWPKLEMLLLEGDRFSSVIPDNSFERMKGLRVLSMHNIQNIPSSVQYLLNLRTLCLEYCSVQDLSFIGELKSLEILSFVHCRIQELSREIGQLKQLRVLELSNCADLKVFPEGVIESLSQLEVLYMYGSFVDWGKNSNARLVELNGLRSLSTIDMHFPGGVELFPEDLNLESLSKFKISFGTEFIRKEWNDSLLSNEEEWNISLFLDQEQLSMFSKPTTLKLGKFHQSIASHHDGVKMLVNKAESLIAEELEEDLEYFLSELNKVGFSKLKCLKVSKNSEIEYIGNVMNEEISQHRILFPALEGLQLEEMQNLRVICQGSLPSGSFCELSELILDRLPNLENLWVGNASLPNLRVVMISFCGNMKNLFSHDKASSFGRQLLSLQVEYCQNLEEIFTYDVNGEEVEVVLSKFKIMKLEYLPKLTTFCSKKSNHISDPIQKALFSQKIAFPNLEEMKVFGKFEEIWPLEITGNSFCRLRVLGIVRCKKIKTVIPSNLVHQLKNLEELSVTYCDCVEEVVEEVQNDLPLPPKLNYIEIKWCRGLRRLFSASQARNLNQLKKLRISLCKEMKEIVGGNTKEIGEEETGDMKIVLPQLEKINLYDLKNLTCFCSGNYTLELPLLKDLNVRESPKLNTLFGGKESQKASSSLSSNNVVKKMTKKTVSANLTEGFNREEDDGLIHSLFNEKVVLPNLRKLEVENCVSLRNLFTPSIVKALACLEELCIIHCSLLEQVVVVVKEEEEEERIQQEVSHHDQDKVIILLFPKLRRMTLIDLPKLRSFYPGNLTLKFPSLEEVYLNGCPHMQNFSSSPVVAPVDTQVSFAGRYELKKNHPVTDYSPEGDLNSVARYLFNKKGEEDERKEKDEEENVRRR